MANKKVILKATVNADKTAVTPLDKKVKGNAMPEKAPVEKPKKQVKKSSALLAASKGRSAVDAVSAHSSKDVRGSSGLANTGTIISYD